MRYLTNLLLRAWTYLLFLLGKRIIFSFVEELPDDLRKNVLYIVVEDGDQWHASLICPCGCGEVTHLNLLPDERPCWKIADHNDGTGSLSPSIWRKVGCRSHYWLTKGRVHWV